MCVKSDGVCYAWWKYEKDISHWYKPLVKKTSEFPNKSRTYDFRTATGHYTTDLQATRGSWAK